MRRLFILFSVFLLLCVSCSGHEEAVGRTCVEIEMEKSTSRVSSYRFVALKGETEAISSDPWMDMGEDSSFYAGEYEPGLWTFAVCGVDSNENTVEFGQKVVYLPSGSAVDINISLFRSDVEGRFGNINLAYNPAPISGTQSAVIRVSRINGDYDESFNVSVTGGKLRWSASLESGTYTAETVFRVNGECYGYDVCVLRVLPDTEEFYTRDARIIPSYILIDFADPRLDYNLSENPTSVCVGLKREGDQDTAILDPFKMYLSPVGKFWSSCEDLGLVPVLKQTADDLMSYSVLALGSGVSTSSVEGLMGQNGDNPNTKLRTLVCFNSSVAKRMFWWCTALETVFLEDGVTSVGEGAFQGCTNLKKVYMAPSITSCGNRLFTGCTPSILKVYVGRTTPLPSAYGRAWAYTVLSENITYGATRDQVFGSQ